MTNIEDCGRDVYSTTCACYDHTLRMYFDKRDMPFALVFDLSSPCPPWELAWYEALWYRVKLSVKILFGGAVEFEGAFIFRDAEHMREVGQLLVDKAKEGQEDAT